MDDLYLTTLPAQCRMLAAHIEPIRSNTNYTYDSMGVMGVAFALCNRDEESIQCFREYQGSIDQSQLETCVANTLDLYKVRKCESPEDLAKVIVSWFNTNLDASEGSVKVLDCVRTVIVDVPVLYKDARDMCQFEGLMNQLGIDMHVKEGIDTLNEEARETASKVMVDFVHTMNVWAASVGLGSATNPWLLMTDSSTSKVAPEDPVEIVPEDTIDQGGGGGGKGKWAKGLIQPLAHLDMPEVQKALSKYLKSVDAMLETTPTAHKSIRMARDEFMGSVPVSEPSERDRVLAEVKKDGLMLRTVPQFRNDREIVMAAVQQRGAALLHASEELKGDREIVMAAVQQRGCALYFTPSDVRDDREIVLAAVNQYGGALQYASANLRNDREIVTAAVGNFQDALVHASAILRGDRKIVTAAVTQYGPTLRFASPELKDDYDVVMAAVNNNGGGALQYASPPLKNNREIVMAALAQSPGALQFASMPLRREIAQQRASAFAQKM